MPVEDSEVGDRSSRKLRPEAAPLSSVRSEASSLSPLAVYISHAAQDAEFVRRLGVSLDEHYGVLASTSQSPESEQQRLSLLSNVEFVLFVVSPPSATRAFGRDELSWAMTSGRPVVFLYLRDIDESVRHQPRFTGPWIDFRDDNRFDEAVAELVDYLRSHPAPSPARPDHVSVPIVGKAGASDLTLNATRELAEVFVRASRLNHYREQQFDLSFSSLLLAFLICRDPVSGWSYERAHESGLDIMALVNLLGMTPAALTSETNRAVDDDELTKHRVPTQSARRLIDHARKIASDTALIPEPALDVIHLLAAFIYEPAGHDQELVSLHFDARTWSAALQARVAAWRPQEIEAWNALHTRKFGKLDTSVRTKGPSAHIARDIWTVDDTLNFRTYAHVIARFLTHPGTRPPLTVSIQAPWGGGKTSLMRMIQHVLDPRSSPDGAVASGTGLTLTQFMSELNRETAGLANDNLPPVPPDNRQRLTIWFNAWKYENTNQVWAGLAHAIMEQVAARLSAVDREKFWLRLQLRRLDVDRIRHRVHQELFAWWWRTTRGIAIAGLLVFLGSAASALLNFRPPIGIAGMLGSAAATTLAGAMVWMRTSLAARKKPAAASLDEFLRPPEYDKELGFVHYVELDIARVLASVPERNKPLVIFIDDLDRCRPENVAEVVEAVNLFLGSETLECIFVIGMDTELVAAALQAAHKEMLSYLPREAGIPVGWRFMDKFVQLPFVIPPAQKPDIDRYLGALFCPLEVDGTQMELVNRLAQNVAERAPSVAEMKQHVASLDEVKNDTVLRQRVEDLARTTYTRRVIDNGISTFSDQDGAFVKRIAPYATYFRNNPREVKRFINACRFNYFLWVAAQAQELETPSEDQLFRWTVFSLRWPEVARWLRRGGDTAGPRNDGSSFGNRLTRFEAVSKTVPFPEWTAEMVRTFDLDPATSWIHDEQLHEFWNSESQLGPMERLSAGSQKRFW